jgi:hypothetical protein
VSIERLDGGIYYVDLTRAAAPDVEAAMERLASAPGVVFDLRDRPHDVERVLSHLLTRPGAQRLHVGVHRHAGHQARRLAAAPGRLPAHDPGVAYDRWCERGPR